MKFNIFCPNAPVNSQSLNNTQMTKSYYNLSQFIPHKAQEYEKCKDMTGSLVGNRLNTLYLECEPTISHTCIALSGWWMGDFLCTCSYWSGWCVGVSHVWPNVYATTRGVCYFLLMVTGSGNSVLVEPLGRWNEYLVQQLRRGKCPGSVLNCGCGIKLTVKLWLQQC